MKQTRIQKFLGALSIAMLPFIAAANGQQPDFHPELDWKYKWHGQAIAVAVISRAMAPQGYHFDGKSNRIREAPWNAIQTLLGAYFVARLEAAQAKAPSPESLEGMVLAQCRAVMAMLSSQQALYEGHVVYQVDDWRPGDSVWHAIWEQPRLADAILSIDPKREAKIRSVLGMRLIPLRSVDNCEIPNHSHKQYSVSQADSDGFEIAWRPPTDPKRILRRIENLKSGDLLRKQEVAEIDSLLKSFEIEWKRAEWKRARA